MQIAFMLPMLNFRPKVSKGGATAPLTNQPSSPRGPEVASSERGFISKADRTKDRGLCDVSLALNADDRRARGVRSSKETAPARGYRLGPSFHRMLGGTVHPVAITK
jgi:hypothetical protein